MKKIENCLKVKYKNRLEGIKNSLGYIAIKSSKNERKRHCIVTPDIIGPINNGGIGTACFHLAKYLRSLGDDVDILFTGPCEINSNEYWQKYYFEEFEIGYYAALDYPQLPDQPINEGRWFMQRSMVIHNWLKTRSYDQIHFQEWQANGFCAMQARRVTGAYSTTLLTVTLHSSSEWQRQGMRTFSKAGVEDVVMEYCERYAVEHADIAIFPSKHMHDWCLMHKWKLPDEVILIPYHIDIIAKENRVVKTVEQLVFFGRLETRKGLEIFIESLKIVSHTNKVPNILFLGKVGKSSNGPADLYIAESLNKLGITYNIITNLSSKECIKLLNESTNTVVVIPSLLDNLPYTVYECLANGIPLIAARTGGIPEMIGSSDHMFDPNSKSLAQKIIQILNSGLRQFPISHLADKAQKYWKQVRNYNPKCSFTLERPSRQVYSSDITICIAHFNYGDYLPALLISLKNQTLKGFKVVIVDDGSTDLESLKTFDHLEETYSSLGWRFLRKSNGGIGHTRNFAASLAGTEYLVFMDADNIAEPNMVERFVAAMSIFNGDLLTCYMRAFLNERESTKLKIVYSYMPPGPCIEAGYKANVFGDANSIILRSSFNKIGGFGEARDSSFEDWELFARFALKGYKMDVIPENLFLYRHTDEGFSRNTSLYLNHNRVLNAYKSALPPWMGRLIYNSFSDYYSN